jgi:hypothetical protein
MSPIFGCTSSPSFNEYDLTTSPLTTLFLKKFVVPIKLFEPNLSLSFYIVSIIPLIVKTV